MVSHVRLLRGIAPVALAGTLALGAGMAAVVLRHRPRTRTAQ
jgi:hypothetical protein